MSQEQEIQKNNDTGIADIASNALSYARNLSTAGSAAGNAAGAVGKEAAGQAAKEIASAVKKEAVKEVAKAAASTATTAAATGGVGAVPTAAFHILKLILNKIKAGINSIGDEPEKPSSHAGSIALIIAPLILILVICTVVSIIPIAILYFPQLLLRELGERAETVYNNFTEKGRFFKEVFDTDIYTLEVNDIVHESRQIDEQNIEIYKAIIDEAIQNAFEERVTQYIDDYIKTTLLEFAGMPVSLNKNQTLEDYKKQPYPYTLADDGEYYTIEEYLNGDIPESELNNDLNYAEIITVLCQNPNFTMDNFSYSSFYDMLINQKVAEYLFEIQFKDEFIVIVEDNGDADANISGTSHELEEILKETKKSNKMTISQKPVVMPYGLNELYQIAEVNPTDPNTNHPSMMNYELLDESEGWLRDRLCNTELGPSYQDERSDESIVYSYIKDAGVQPTGRSLAWYLEDSLNLDQTIGYNPNEDWRNIEFIQSSYVPTGESVILDMPQYINQGHYPKNVRGDDGKGDTIKKSGCIDCSYAMCLAYYTRNLSDIKTISKDYVSDNAFDSNTFLSDNNLTQNWNEAYNAASVVSYITSGYPVVLHIEGVWEYKEVQEEDIDGVVTPRTVQHKYHTTSNGHFLLIIGYDDCGFYVLDPGRSSNNRNVIPFNAFNYVDGKYIRPVMPGENYKDFTPSYKVNTLAEEEE